MVQELEEQLDSFDREKRLAALEGLCALAADGAVSLPEPSDRVNMHFHTFFSYNSNGYSPAKVAWLARRAGLALAGIVDFDVLDGLDEFVQAGWMLDLPTCGGLETRAFVPEFADLVINSPGEPGITYHMGMGFPSGTLTGRWKAFQERLQQTAQQRNRDLIGRVNAYLSPVELDYTRDVLPLTPCGNPTERHICLAYARRAAARLDNLDELRAFWCDKLGTDVAVNDLPEGPGLLNRIRAKTMKRGGPGYVPPDAGAFPRMAQVNEFVLAVGGIPTLTWLDGLSEGERQIERLLDAAMSTGVQAINIIPDRNFTPGLADERLANLRAVIDLACRRDLPIVVGTEMNSPGQKFVDRFDAAELRPYVPMFLRGARIMYAHSVLQRRCGLGYSSDWAQKLFPQRADRNAFYEAVGKELRPSQESMLTSVNPSPRPDEVFPWC